MTRRIKPAERIAQVEAAIAAGDTPQHIAETLGYRATTVVASILRRADRRDLAAYFTKWNRSGLAGRDGTDRIPLIAQAVADGIRPEIILKENGLRHAGSMRKVLQAAGRDDLLPHFLRSKEQQTADMLEDVVFLCQFRTDTDEIVRRVGADSRSAVARMLFRAGKPELAQRFEPRVDLAA